MTVLPLRGRGGGFPAGFTCGYYSKALSELNTAEKQIFIYKGCTFKINMQPKKIKFYSSTGK